MIRLFLLPRSLDENKMDVNQFLNRCYLPGYVTVVNHNHDGRNSFGIHP